MLHKYTFSLLHAHPPDSSEAMLSGRKPPFRLLVKAVHLRGAHINIRHAVSEGFVVATRRTRTAGKVWAAAAACRRSAGASYDAWRSVQTGRLLELAEVRPAHACAHSCCQTAMFIQCGQPRFCCHLSLFSYTAVAHVAIPPTHPTSSCFY